jgi:hemerythrin
MDLNWNQSLATGNVAIDRQHQELFSRMEKLLLVVQGSNQPRDISDAISFLENYVFRHFHAEEKIQIANHYPDYESHKNQHREFLITIANLRKELNDDGSNVALLLKSIAIIGNWITNHVNQRDKDLAAFLRGEQCLSKTGYTVSKTA